MMPERKRIIASQQTARLLLLAVVLLVNVSPFFNHELLLEVSYGFIFIAVLVSKKWEYFHLSALVFLIRLVSALFPMAVSIIPSIKFLIPLAISTSVVLFVPDLRASLSWVRKGTIDRLSLILILITVVVSSGALLLWALGTDNLGAGVGMAKRFLRFPRFLVFAVGVPLFALVNAFAEEIVFRGVMQSALGTAFKRPSLVLILQASAFAAFHVAGGFPNGYTGYLMTFVYGLMMGYLRDRTEGLLAPYCAHIGADLTIGYFLCSYVS